MECTFKPLTRDFRHKCTVDNLTQCLDILGYEYYLLKRIYPKNCETSWGIMVNAPKSKIQDILVDLAHMVEW